MRPVYWRPPIELSAREQTIINRIRRAKLFVFLRLHRHEVFDEAFQQELASLYVICRISWPPGPAYASLTDRHFILHKRALSCHPSSPGWTWMAGQIMRVISGMSELDRATQRLDHLYVHCDS